MKKAQARRSALCFTESVRIARCCMDLMSGVSHRQFCNAHALVSWRI